MNIIAAILIFGLLVFIHELGHFIFARLNGIYVEEFAIGMGPKILGKKHKDTLYSLRAVPFGGYCKMLGEDESSDDARAFSAKSVGRRISVIIGGPLFNILLAFILATISLFIQEGLVTTKIEAVVPDSPAMEAGIKPGDQLIKINGRRIISYREISLYINESGGEAIDVVIKNQEGRRQTLTIVPFLSEEGIYRIGTTHVYLEKPGFFTTIKYGFLEMVFHVKLVFYSLNQLILGRVSLNEVSGPVGIGQAISQSYTESAKFGIKALLQTLIFYTALFSANLGIFNLLPIPALDGGRLVFLTIEGIRRKKIDPDKEGMVHAIGYVILMGLMVLVMFNDIRKLFL